MGCKMAVSTTRFEERLERISKGYQKDMRKARKARRGPLRKMAGVTLRIALFAFLIVSGGKLAALYAYGDEGYARRAEKLVQVLPESARIIEPAFEAGPVSMWIIEKARKLPFLV